MKKYYTVIYAYTTALRIPKGRVKVGSARREATSAVEAARQRISEQSTAISSDDPAQILEVFDVSDLCETGAKRESLSNLRTLEQSFLHKRMKDDGMWFAGDQGGDAVKDTSEWFYAKTTNDVVNAVKSLLNQRRVGVSRPNSYPMRDEQVECHDRAVVHFKSGGDRFLINAKMRFGKTFTAYQIAKSVDVQNVLVLTYKPQVEAGWAEDLETHVDFDGWDYYYAKDFSRYDPVVLGDNDNVNVLFASFQDLNDMNKAKWKNLKNYHFDMVIVDEQHYGLETTRAKSTLNAISFSKILEVSGTPMHALMSGKFLDEEIYSWTYADEQRKRQIEKDNGWATEIYRWLPVMEFMVFKISDEARRLCSFYDGLEGFTMQKMFASDGVTFKDESAVKLWLENAYGINTHKNSSPIYQYNSDHMVWKLPSVNACNAMAELIKKAAWVKHSPVVVSGSRGTDLAGVKQAIQRFDKTVTLTCGSLMTGTTVPEWDMIFMLDGGSSAQDYFQTIYRVQSSNKAANKEKCYVVDYNPQRNLEMIYEYAFVQSTVNNTSSQKNVQEFLDFAPVMDHTGNSPVRKDVNDVLDAVANTSNAIEKFGSGLNVRFDKVSNDVLDILDPVKQSANTKRETTVNDNDLSLGKNKTTPNKRKPSQIDLARKKRKELQQKAITVVQSLPNYLWLETRPVDTLQDIIAVGDDEAFKREVGISIEEMKTLCDLEFLNTKRINLCILGYQQLQQQLF